MAIPILPNISPIIQAGINPKTGLPFKLGTCLGETKPYLKTEIKKQIRILDEQQFVNRYRWYNLPKGLNGELIERVLYYKGQGCMFYNEGNGMFLFLPYALNGTIDCYGRFTGITPLPFNGTSRTNDGKGVKPFIDSLILKPHYDVLPFDEVVNDIENTFLKGCVILKDYTPQMDETIIPRQTLNDSIVDLESEIFPMARTAMIANSGVSALKVNNEDEQSNVDTANESFTQNALIGNPFVGIVGSLDFQNITTNGNFNSQNFLMYMQAVDNYRMSLLGIENGGVFEKNERKLVAEQNMDSFNSTIIYEDGLRKRQEFANICNSIWGTEFWCDTPEYMQGIDMNGDMELDNDIDQSGEGNDIPEGVDNV